jgi:hypothetical protein
MHLDMILSQVRRNIFTFHQPLNQKIEIFHLQQVYLFILNIFRKILNYFFFRTVNEFLMAMIYLKH